MSKPISIILLTLFFILGFSSCRAAAEAVEETLPNGEFAALCLPGIIEATWTGDCTLGLAQGRGVATFDSKETIFASIEGTFVDGWPIGEVKIKYQGGGSYEGGWYKENHHGYGIEIEAWGEAYEGNWIHGFRDGWGIYTSPNGKKIKGLWRKGSGFVGRWYVDDKSGCQFFWGIRDRPEAKAEWKGSCVGGKASGPARVRLFTSPEESFETIYEFEGRFVKGQIKGTGVLNATYRAKNLTETMTYNGGWHDSERSGFGIETSQTRNTAGESFFEQDKKYEGEWKNGIKYGLGVSKIVERRENETKTKIEDVFYGDDTPRESGTLVEVIERPDGVSKEIFEGVTNGREKAGFGTLITRYENKEGVYVSEISGDWTGNMPKEGVVKYRNGDSYEGKFQSGIGSEATIGSCHFSSISFYGRCEVKRNKSTDYSGNICFVPEGKQAPCLKDIGRWFH